ncbi:MAG: hypothetical protein ACE5NW_06150 [Acidiferrobacterales bacterium]
MSYPNYHLASLNNTAVQTVQVLEKDLDKVVVALAPDASVAKLSGEHLNRLKEVERKLGVVLVAYEQS